MASIGSLVGHGGVGLPAAGSRSPRCGWWPSGSCRAASGPMARGCCSAPVGLAFCSAQGHSGTRRALRVDEVTVDAGMHVREAIDEAVVDDHAEHLGEGVRFTAVVVSATARAAASCRHLDRLGHAAAVILRSPRRLRRSPEDAPLRPAGALVNRTSPADCRITDPRVSNCWSPMRSAPVRGPPACGPSGWRRSGRASSAGGTRHGWGGAARHPRRVDVPPRGRPDTNTECRSSQGPCASSVTPNPDTPMVAYGWWYARTGIIWSSSGRTRPVPVAPCGRSSGALLGTFATACCSAPGQLFMRAGTASAAVAGPTPSAVPVLETGIDPRLVITS